MLGYQPLGFYPSQLGVFASGLLILTAFIYLIYILVVTKVRLTPELVLLVLLLFAIAIGIHSLQHQGQEVHYSLKL